MSESYVTVATNDITSLGCLVLCNSLKQTGTEKKISVLVYPEVSLNLRNILVISFDYVFYTQDLFLPNVNENQLTALEGYEKLKCWLLIKFTKCIFLESDVLVIENIDDLFERPELSAVADPRWPDYFDVGVFVYTPNSQTYISFIDFISKHDISDKSIQSLLNAFFSNWAFMDIENKIPFVYNCQLNSTFYTITNALVHFGRSIKVARLGNSVFEMVQPDMSHDPNYDNWNQLWLRWWQIYNEMVKPSLKYNEVSKFVRTNVDYGGEKPVDNSNKNYNVQSDSSSYVHNEYIQKSEVTDNTPKVIENTNITITSECPSDHTRNESGIYLDENDTFHKEAKIDTNILATIRPQTNVSKYDDESGNQNKQTLSIALPILVKNEFLDKSKHKFQNIVETDTNISSLIADSEELENIHRQQWERGEIDYMGIDSFQNILSKLISYIEQGENSNLNLEE